MNTQEYQFLLAERGELARLLGKIPAKRFIDRISLQSRLDDVNAALARVPPREPLQVRLTFRGKPVVEQHGIQAEFGGEALKKFTDSVMALAAGFSGPLAAFGAIPGRGQSPLLVTRTVAGSFGFVLEEHVPEGAAEADDAPTPMEKAVTQAGSLLRAALGSDDDLADAAAGADPRAVKKLHEFIRHVASWKASCALSFKDEHLDFRDDEEVARCAARLSQENLHEEEQRLSGAFQGVLPGKREFEFRLDADGSLIGGRVGPMIADAGVINRHVGQPRLITVQTTRAGNSAPRYLLLGFDEA